MDIYDDNAVFYSFACALADKKRQRLKGYFICPDCGEFIRAAATKSASCPFCGRQVDRIMYIDSVIEQTIHDRWKACGTYTEKAAGLYQEKERYLA